MSGFTTYQDRLVRNHIFKEIFGGLVVSERTWGLLKGEMPWDGVVYPTYVKDWWYKQAKDDSRTYVQRWIDWTVGTLQNRGVVVEVNGPNAHIRVDAVDEMNDADRILVKRSCLRRAGVIYKARQVRNVSTTMRQPV